MTNPGDIVRIRSRNGGRASVYEANMWAQAYTSGLLSGAGVVENGSPDMNVLVGGSPSNPDVAIGINPSNYRIALDIVGQQAIAITAPGSNSRYTAIVAYTEDLAVASTEDDVTGSPSTCGLIAVNGSTSADPGVPTDGQIRSAITSDGGTGSQAAYCVLANVLVANNTTTITNALIERIEAAVPTAKIGEGAVTADKTSFGGSYSTSEVNTGFKWVDDKDIYKKTVNFGSLPNNTNKTVAHGITGLDTMVSIDAFASSGSDRYPIPFVSAAALASQVALSVDATNITIATGTNRTSWSAYVTLFYTKSS